MRNSTEGSKLRYITVLVCITIALLSQYARGGLIIWIGVWVLYLLILSIIYSNKRVLSLFWVATSLYGVSAYSIYRLSGIEYPPHPSAQIMANGTALSLEALTIATGLSFILFSRIDLQKWLGEAVAVITNKVVSLSKINRYLLLIFLAIPGCHDLYKVLQIGVSTILHSPRRHFSPALWATSNHNVQIIGIPSTLIIVLYILVNLFNNQTRRWTWLGVFGVALLLYWGPFLIVGSRKELLYVLIGTLVFVMYWAKRYTVLLSSVLGVCILLLFLIPSLKSGYWYTSLNEFVLPKYFLLSLMQYHLHLHYNYLIGALLMLPHALRGVSVTNLGTAFGDAHITTVGVGADPVGEAYLNAGGNWGVTILFFCVATALLLYFVYFLGRYVPTAALLGCSFMVIWGRSDFWITVSFITYTSLVSYVVLSTRWIHILEWFRTLLQLRKHPKRE